MQANRPERWPSGQWQSFQPVAADKFYVITEGVELALQRFAPVAARTVVKDELCEWPSF
jgi:hypothetical protein